MVGVLCLPKERQFDVISTFTSVTFAEMRFTLYDFVGTPSLKITMLLFFPVDSAELNKSCAVFMPSWVKVPPLFSSFFMLLMYCFKSALF